MTQQQKLFVSVLLILLSLSPAAHGAVGFQTAQSYPVGTNPRAVAVGDFNGDNKMDLAVVNFGDPTVSDNGSVSMLLGNGDGMYQPANNVVAGKNPFSIAVGDFNGDGRLDIVTVNSDNTVTSLLGNGDGTLQAHVEYGTGSGPDFVAVGDFNADGRPDLVTCSVSGQSLITSCLHPPQQELVCFNVEPPHMFSAEMSSLPLISTDHDHVVVQRDIFRSN